MFKPVHAFRTKNRLVHLWSPNIDIDGPTPINEPIELHEIDDVLRELDIPNQERDFA